MLVILMISRDSRMKKLGLLMITVWQAAESDLLLIEEHEPGYGEDIALICETAPSCRFDDSVYNLHLTVPNGWVLSFPYFYKTAGGAKSDKATISFIRQRDGVTVNLNARQAGGKCIDTRAGRLCYFTENQPSENELGIIVMGANE